MTPREAATKRYTDAGGTWPPGPPWPVPARSVRRVRLRVAAADGGVRAMRGAVA